MRLFLIFLIFSFIPLWADSDTTETEKQNIINQIVRIRQQENEIISSLEKIERDIKVYEEKITDSQVIVDSLELQIRRLESSVSENREKLKNRRQSYFQSLRNYYVKRDSSYLNFLFTTSSTDEFLRRSKYLQHITKKEEVLLYDLLAGLKNIEAQQTSLQDKKEEIDYHKEKLLFDKKQLVRAKGDKEDILSRIRQKQEELQIKYDEFQLGSAKISKVLKDIGNSTGETETSEIKPVVPPTEDTSETVELLPNGKISLIWPIGDINSVVAFFGSQKNQFNTSFFNTGINIACPKETPVKASASGKVMYKGVVEGYGNVLILDHGNGFTTLYAHLKDIMVGINEELKAGDSISTVEENPEMKVGVLHFELRSHGEPQDPLKWL
jgi:peptidoglycan DL-endopeptidase CwlO